MKNCMEFTPNIWSSGLAHVLRNLRCHSNETNTNMTLTKDTTMQASDVSNVEICNLAYHGNLDKCKSLLKDHPNLAEKTDQDGRNPLHWACSAGKTDVAEYLMRFSNNSALDINSVDDIGWSALHIASSAGRDDIVNTLLSQQRIDVSISNNTGQTALHYAASKGRYQICEALLRGGVPVNVSDQQGHTALHRACSTGHTRVVTLLLQQPGISVDVQDKQGNTPLHLSCEEDAVDISKLLVQHGASLTIRNKEEQCPTDVGSKAMATTLQRCMDAAAAGQR